MSVKSIYVAATRQHVGKTTSTLGLVTALKNKGIKVGYCKPVGQQSVNFKDLQVDKDALLFSGVMDFELEANVHSPVILGKGATAAYIDNPTLFDYRKQIQYASNIIEQRNELVIYEGTGHPGVGSVVGLSNADVAKMLDAGVVMIVEGGIGSTIDMLSLCIAKFQLLDVPLLGVILNKVDSSKLDKVAYYVGKVLKDLNIPLLGILPYDRSLAFPLMRTVCSAVRGVVVLNDNKLNNKVEDIISGSLLDVAQLENSNGLLLVASSRMVDSALFKIEEICTSFGRKESPLSGIIATEQGDLQPRSLNYINQHEIPLVRTSLDTFGVVLRYSHIEVKINRSTPWKIKRAIQLIEENVNLDLLLGQLSLTSLSK